MDGGGSRSDTPSQSPLLKLNVRGKEFVVAKDGIDRFPESLLADLVAECPDALTREQALFIDRDPTGFEVILKVYRTGRFEPSDLHQGLTLADLCSSLDFYNLPNWKELIVGTDGMFMGMRTEMILSVPVKEMLNQLTCLETVDLIENVPAFILYWRTEDSLAVRSLDICKFERPYRQRTVKVLVGLDAYPVASLSKSAKGILATLLEKRRIYCEIKNVSVTLADHPDHVKCLIEGIFLSW